MMTADQHGRQGGAEDGPLPVLARLRQRVSPRGVPYLAGALEDGRAVFVFERLRPARDGSTHALCVAPARHAP